MNSSCFSYFTISESFMMNTLSTKFFDFDINVKTLFSESFGLRRLFYDDFMMILG
jgi:hypothetical protein